MTEKQQIEEMALSEVNLLANDINQHCPDLAENYCGGTNCLICLTHALYNAGYRKIPENAVVLTKEEHSDYLVLKNDYEHASEKLKELQGDNERLYRTLGKFKDSVRKETAKEIFTKLIEVANNQHDKGKLSVGLLKAWAIEYGVEVDE